MFLRRSAGTAASAPMAVVSNAPSSSDSRYGNPETSEKHADQAVQAAENAAREGLDEKRTHQIGIEEQRGRNQHAGDGTDQSAKAPGNGRCSCDRNSHQPRHGLVLARGPQAE